jgi:hypothetical protein
MACPMLCPSIMAPDDILAQLTAIANDGMAVAVAWHAALALVLVLLARGWRPSRMQAMALLALPIASVSVAAWIHGNPVNGSLFALLALALPVIGAAAPTGRVAAGPAWSSATGAAMITFGWVYPHFLVGHPTVAYLWAAPVGLVPCPTLSVVIGFVLLGGGLGTRVGPGLLAAVGLLYGVMGIVVLGVVLDLGLVIGAGALAVMALRARGARLQAA